MATTERRRPEHSTPTRAFSVRAVSGPSAGVQAEVEAGESLTVGTARGNDLVLRDPSVSRYHLEISAQGEGYRVRDLGSSNGTWLGSTDIADAVVAPETQIGVGDSVLVVERGALGSTRPAADPIPGMVAVSPAMERVASMVHKVAPSSVSVLIQGETGTGKEVVARAIHALSPRSEAPLEIVDCGSLPAALIASELFGHERGSFTGADRRRLGAFERADGGTVFLDEVGELPLALQPALLGVLQRSQFRRVGGESTQTVDVRVVAATHRDLRAGANDGSFRADLYYRLAVARILVPALRDRRDDITPLVEHFARELTGGPSPFSPAALSAFEAHPWGGNVRELRNVVEASLALGTLSLAPSVSAPSHDSGELPTYRDARAAAIEEFELRYLPRLIESCEGNASEAARRARMDRPYLLSLLRKHGLR